MGKSTRVPPEAMGHTTRGKRWEWMQSWYLLGFLTVYFYWVPMLYTGVRVVQPKWILWSVIYSLPGLVSLLTNTVASGTDYWINRWMFACYVIAVIHTLVARGEFLVRLQSMQDEREELMHQALIRAGLAEQERLEQSRSQPRFERTGPQQPLEVAPLTAKRFDVNTIGEREIALLPGMGSESARQAVTLRETLREFRSFDHFADKMGLGDDVRRKLRPMFEDPDAPSPPPLAPNDPAVRVLLDGRRVLELNLADVESMAALPGVGAEAAGRAIALRDADGPYKSLEDFRYRVGLSMDVIVKISPLVSTTRTRKPPADGVKPSGRVLDI